MLMPSHSYKTCGGTKAITSTTILKKCGGKLAGDGGNATSCKLIMSSPAQLSNKQNYC